MQYHSAKPVHSLHTSEQHFINLNIGITCATYATDISQTNVAGNRLFNFRDVVAVWWKHLDETALLILNKL